MNGGGEERQRKRGREGEKADIYCGCLMTGREQEQGGEMWRERCSDRMRKPREREKCESECCGARRGGEDSETSKKPVAGDTERGADPVAPPLWVNNHHKPWLCLMNPLPMS